MSHDRNKFQFFFSCIYLGLFNQFFFLDRLNVGVSSKRQFLKVFFSKLLSFYIVSSRSGVGASLLVNLIAVSQRMS